MRIIAGKYKKFNLFTLSGSNTRPTTDALREAIFSSLYDVTDYNVLDLFSGSGAYALEALSRGAKSAVMVDQSYAAIQIIKKNITKLGCREKTRISKKKVSTFLEKNEEKFDLILLDPPYNKGLVNKTLDEIMEYDAINDGGIIVTEHYFLEKPDDKWNDFVIYKKDKGKNRITILKIEK